MPINLERLEAFFVEAGFKYRLADDDHVVAAFATKSYRNDHGHLSLVVVVSVSEEGEFLEFTSPQLYDARRCRDPGALFQALLDITQRTKLIRFEHDPEDGEISCTVAYPVEDGGITRRQFRRLLEVIPKAVDRWDPVIRLAIEQGVVDLSAVHGQPATGGD